MKKVIIYCNSKDDIGVTEEIVYWTNLGYRYVIIEEKDRWGNSETLIGNQIFYGASFLFDLHGLDAGVFIEDTLPYVATGSLIHVGSGKNKVTMTKSEFKEIGYTDADALYDAIMITSETIKEELVRCGHDFDVQEDIPLGWYLCKYGEDGDYSCPVCSGYVEDVTTNEHGFHCTECWFPIESEK